MYTKTNYVGSAYILRHHNYSRSVHACMASWRRYLPPLAQYGQLLLHRATEKQALPKLVAALLHAHPDAACMADVVRCVADKGRCMFHNLSMSVHIYTCKYTYLYLHVYMYLREYVFKYTYKHMYKYTYIHVYVHINLYTYIYVFIHLFTYRYIYIYKHMYIHAYVYIYMYYMLVYMHISLWERISRTTYYFAK